jgi:DTW domain-containing protein YfiP
MTLARAEERAERLRCRACELPLRACVCGLVASVANRVDVLVLQHPLEAREAKGSARLLRLSLARCRVVVGEAFDAARLSALLHGDGARSVLLYPQDAAAPASSDAAGARATQLVVLDATWRKSLRMLRANALLQALPRLALVPARAGRYGALRKARLATQLSTLEATCEALGVLEGDAARYAPLLDAFDRFVADRAARAAP